MKLNLILVTKTSLMIHFPSLLYSIQDINSFLLSKRLAVHSSSGLKHNGTPLAGLRAAIARYKGNINHSSFVTR